VESVSCPVCGSTKHRPFLEVPDTLGLTDAVFTIVRCGDCGLAFLNPRPTGEEMAAYYPSGYCWQEAGGQGLVAGLADAYRQLLMRSDIGTVRRFLPRPGRALDVGCGSGDMIALLQAQGWEVYGVESAGPAARYAREKRGLEVHEGDLASAQYPSEHFDLVTYFQVLEHVADVGGNLAECRRILKPDGRLLVQVPNIGSRQFQSFRERWLHLSAPQHLNHFDLETLGRALDRHGFSVVSTRTLSLRMDPLVLVVSTWPAFLGCVFPGLAGRESGLAAKGLYFLLSLAAVPVVWADSLGGRGATITAIAKKK
jgi:SAM-dependent methyltransferase